MNTDIGKLLNLTGLMSALLLILVVVLGSAYQPGFDHVRDYISQLNDAGSLHQSLVGYLGFLPVGILSLMFIYILSQRLNSDKRTQIGLVFLSLLGIDWVVTAFFPCDLGCPVTGDVSMAQLIHSYTGLFYGMLVPVGVYLLIKPIREINLVPFFKLTSIFVIVVNVLTFAMIVSDVFSDHVGLLQRLNLIALYGYISILSLKLYQRHINVVTED